MDTNPNSQAELIDVGQLEVGMYVVGLDRSWKDTPFQQQGFEILSDSEIELLRQYCKRVYVTPGYVGVSAMHRVRRLREQVGTNTAQHMSQVVESQRLQVHAYLSDKDIYVYKRKGKRRQNARLARQAFDDARTGLNRLMAALGNSKPVEAKHCRGVVEPIARCIMDDPDTMAWLAFINKSDPLPLDRQISTAVWAGIFSRHLGLAPPVLLDVTSGGLLLDIGTSKMATSLREHSGTFVGRERLAMQSHVTVGHDMLAGIPGISERVRQMQVQHHERLDGSGYPARLQDSAISPFGSLAGIIDSYDAMISDTAYRPALSSADAITQLQSLGGTHFPRPMVEQFVHALGLFPSGSIVELNTGEIAIVVEQDARERLRPVVLVVCNEHKDTLERPFEVRLEGDAARDEARFIKKGHPIGTYGIQPDAYFP